MPSHKDQAGCGVGTVVRASAVSAVLTETEPWHRPHRLKKEWLSGKHRHSFCLCASSVAR